jgi:ferredoxin
MKRKIVKIDEEKCNGCGLCVKACHENALQMINGKAKLVSETYCDGLGDCLPECPTGAITIEEREAEAYAVPAPGRLTTNIESQLRQWPCQIKLIPVDAPYLTNAHLLIAADCTAFAYANIHQEFMRNKITLIGCPKLDDIDYSEKLTEIIKRHEIRSITVLRMEVPCCGGIVHAVKKALIGSGKMIPWNVITISTDGTIIEE